MRHFIPPRESGEGGPRSCAVGRASDSPLRFRCRIVVSHRPRPLHHASHGSPPPPPPPLSRGRMHAPPFSRCGFASESCHATVRKPFVPPSNKEGRRSADKRIHWSPPHRSKESLPAYAARAMFAPCPALARNVRDGALAFRRSTAVMRRGALPPNSAPGRASWNHRIQTGGPSPAPVQPAPGSPGHAPDGRCPKPPGRAVYGRATAPLRLGVPSRRRPSSSGILIRGLCNALRDNCQNASSNTRRPDPT